jgi:molybdopterin-binding protein
MPKKQQGWITFQSSEAERQLLENYCQQSQRSKTEVLRELLRMLAQISSNVNIPVNSQGSDLEKSIEQKTEHKAMKVSARNLLKGTVKKVVTGAVNDEVTLEIAPGVEVVSIITRASAESMGLSEGKEVYAVIKSSDVMIAVD